MFAFLAIPFVCKVGFPVLPEPGDRRTPGGDTLQGTCRSHSAPRSETSKSSFEHGGFVIELEISSDDFWGKRGKPDSILEQAVPI